MTEYRLVPLEPTDAMIAAGISERHLQGVPEAWKLATVNIYKAMIDAAPKQTVEKTGTEITNDNWTRI